MKRILRLDEDDIIRILTKCYKVQPDQVRAFYADQEDKDTEEIESKFFVEIEENAR